MGIEPKNTVKKIWVRMPNWLGDFVMAFPHLRAIKAHQPEAQLTLIAKPQFKDLIELFPIADEFVPLQKGTIRSFRSCQLWVVTKNRSATCCSLIQFAAISRLGLAALITEWEWRIPADIVHS